MVAFDKHSANPAEQSSPCTMPSLSQLTSFAYPEKAIESHLKTPLDDVDAYSFSRYCGALLHSISAGSNDNFESMLDRGIEAVLFLNQCNREIANGDTTIGKACTIRSHIRRPEKVEFGVR